MFCRGLRDCCCCCLEPIDPNRLGKSSAAKEESTPLNSPVAGDFAQPAPRLAGNMPNVLPPVMHSQSRVEMSDMDASRSTLPSGPPLPSSNGQTFSPQDVIT